MNKMEDIFSKNMKNTTVGIVLATILTGLSYLIANWAGWADLAAINYLEAFAVFTSYVCTWLCVHQTRWNYPIGIVTTFAYSILFWQFELYALSLFNLYLVFSLAFGYWRWKSDDETIPVTFVDKPWWLGYAALAAIIYGLLWIINTTLGNEMGLVDVGLAVASGVAQFLLDNKKLESWGFWIVINVFSIYLYFTSGLYIVAFQYVFFLLNAFFGAYMWWKSYEKNNEVDNFDEELQELTFPDRPLMPQQMAVFD